MARFQWYTFREQAGDELVLVNGAGQERRVPFQILDVSVMGQTRFLAWLTEGAWVSYTAQGEFITIPSPTAANEVDALTAFLASLRHCGVMFDQVDRSLPSISPAV